MIDFTRHPPGSNAAPKVVEDFRRQRDLEERVNQIWHYTRTHRNSLDSETHCRNIAQMVAEFLPCDQERLEDIGRKHRRALSDARRWKRKYQELIADKEAAH